MSCPNCKKIERPPRVLTSGMRISFFGTEYIIDEVLDYDKVKVTLNNGVSINLWFPNLEGREIIETPEK